MISNHSGVALVQVLLMTAIMSLIAIYFSKTAGLQVEIANDFNSRLEAELELRSVRSQVLFEFFRHDPVDLLNKKHVGNTRWRLNNTPFDITKDTSVRIQAANGLLSASSAPDELLEKALLGLGYSQPSAQRIIATVKDWVDVDDSPRSFGAEKNAYTSSMGTGPRNGPMQHLNELRAIEGLGESDVARLKPLFTVYSTPSFNPLAAPQYLLDALYPEEVYQQIEQGFQNGKHAEAIWRDIQGSEQQYGSFIDTHPWAIFSIRFLTQKGDVKLDATLDIRVQTQQQREPILIMSKY